VGLLASKRLLVTGLLTDSSIAFHVARLAQEEGATVLLTSFGRHAKLTAAFARRLPATAPVLELDVTSSADLADLPGAILEHVGGLDGVLHSIAHAPRSALGEGLLGVPWAKVATTVQISTHSLATIAATTLPLLSRGSSIVGLTFDSSRAWPGYDWMGVAKAGLESACRYLARDLGPFGVRVNLVAAGPLRTTAGTAIRGFDAFARQWSERAPLGWDPAMPEPAARACLALMSDWFPATSGEIVHVDGGVHSVG
jgi:enoyl-[acyl-carrier protein] reductase I